MRVLTERELNRALLARQLLLERARVPVPEALELMGCLQAQYSPSMYVGLWSRVEGFRREDLTHALEQREVVQGTLMRVTIHLVSVGDYWPLAVAVRDARRHLWLRATRHAVSADELAASAEVLRERLRDGPVRRTELDQLVGKDRSIGVGLWVDLVRVPPSGTWERRRADLYGLAEDWLGPPPADLTVEVATKHLVRRYLQGFGPATAPSTRKVHMECGVLVLKIRGRCASAMMPLRRAWTSRLASQVGRKRTGAGVAGSGIGASGRSWSGRPSVSVNRRSGRRSSSACTSAVRSPPQSATSAAVAGPKPCR